MEIIEEERLRNIASETGLNLLYLEKDFFLTMLLFIIKDIEGIYFKGGTAINKIFLNAKRLSEDLDFTAKRPIEDIKREIESMINENKNIFLRIGKGKTTQDFIRYKIYYKSYFQPESFIALDINRKPSIILKTEEYKIPNYYNLNFKIKTLNVDEIIAEKFRAVITRNKPRDYFDLYFLLKKYKIDMGLVKIKVKEVGEEFNMERIFKNSRKIYKDWNFDIPKLTNEKLDFVTCIKFIKSKVR